MGASPDPFDPSAPATGEPSAPPDGAPPPAPDAEKAAKKNAPTAYVILEDAEYDFVFPEMGEGSSGAITALNGLQAQMGEGRLVIEHPFRITAKGSQVARRSAYERLRDERASDPPGDGEKVPGKVGKLRAVPVISYKGSHWREEQTTKEIAEHD